MDRWLLLFGHISFSLVVVLPFLADIIDDSFCRSEIHWKMFQTHRFEARDLSKHY